MILSKTNLGSTEKDWLKDPSSYCSSGKQSAGSLERLREKIGQITSRGAVKSTTQKVFDHHRHLDSSTLEHHFVGELHTRGSALNVSETPVHVYRDEMFSHPGGAQKEILKADSQRRKRELNSRILSQPLLEHARNSDERDHEGCAKPISLLTPNAEKDNGLMHSHVPTFSNGTMYKKKLPASDPNYVKQVSSSDYGSSELLRFTRILIIALLSQLTAVFRKDLVLNFVHLFEQFLHVEFWF